MSVILGESDSQVDLKVSSCSKLETTQSVSADSELCITPGSKAQYLLRFAPFNAGNTFASFERGQRER